MSTEQDPTLEERKLLLGIINSALFVGISNEDGQLEACLPLIRAHVARERQKDIAAHAEQVADLRKTCDELVTDGNAVTLARSLHRMEAERNALAAQVAELRKHITNLRQSLNMETIKALDCVSQNGMIEKGTP